MKIKLIGLGKMGENIAYNLIDNKYQVDAFDKDNETLKRLKDTKINVFNNIEKLLKREKETEKLIVWLLVPNEYVEGVIAECLPHLNDNDIIIDGGNSNFNLSIERYNYLKSKNIDFIDVGTSGGTSGARNGACLMVGGDFKVVKEVEQVFKDIAIKDGYGYFGKAGSGHFVKMVHNGIEYGMMQAIGEGLELIDKSSFDVDFEKLTDVWNHGSIITSNLMGYTNLAFKNDLKLEEIKGIIDDSGEGRWMLEEALNYEVSMPVIANSLFVRYKSRDPKKFSERSVAAMRKIFGGHATYKKDE